MIFDVNQMNYAQGELIFCFIVEHTVAVALEIGICDLLLEFLANAFCVGGGLASARTVTAALTETFFDDADDFSVLIKSYGHGFAPFESFFALIISPQNSFFNDEV